MCQSWRPRHIEGARILLSWRSALAEPHMEVAKRKIHMAGCHISVSCSHRANGAIVPIVPSLEVCMMPSKRPRSTSLFTNALAMQMYCQPSYNRPWVGVHHESLLIYRCSASRSAVRRMGSATSSHKVALDCGHTSSVYCSQSG